METHNQEIETLASWARDSDSDSVSHLWAHRKRINPIESA